MTASSSGEQFENIESFKENGFILVRNILSSEEVKNLRDFILKQTRFYDNPNIFFSEDVLNCPEIYRIPFRQKVVAILKKLHGPNLFYTNEIHVQHNMFGQPGWHMDCDTEVPAAYLLQPNYKFSKCGIYLQDNTPEWGGGIGVLQKAHTFPVRSGIPKVDFFFKKLLTKLRRDFNKLVLDIKAGDMVIFDSRLPHCPTIPGNMHELKISPHSKVSGIPDEFSKSVIYWNAGTKISADNYLKNLVNRWKNQVNKIEREPINSNYPLHDAKRELAFLGIIKNYYPDDFQDEFVRLAESHSIKISCLGKEECCKLKDLHEKYIGQLTENS